MMSVPLPVAPVAVVAAYRFVDLPDAAALRGRWLALAQRLQLKGTVLLAPEGANIALAGSEAALREWFEALAQDPRWAGLDIKWQRAAQMPFRRLHIKLKREIVTFRQASVDPVNAPAPFMNAAELKRRLDAGEDIVLLDTRNDVEVEKGTFDGALFWGNRNFTEFANAAREHIGELENKTVVSFCTGGIRCEKAAPFLQSLGAKNVFQPNKCSRCAME